MREILFRGKRSDNGEWVEGYAAESGYTFIICDYGLTCGYFTVLKVDDGTIGQYTGLTDKNGVKIFEGDIIALSNKTDGERSLGYVEFSERGFWAFMPVNEGDFFYQSENLNDIDTALDLFWIIRSNEYDGAIVIGNVHDNPELLETEG